MKKVCIYLMLIFFLSSLTTACNIKQNSNSMVQSKRRFAQYVEPQQNKQSGQFVDLSEGPKLKYDAHLGPQNLNFDFKIVDPY